MQTRVQVQIDTLAQISSRHVLVITGFTGPLQLQRKYFILQNYTDGIT